MSASALVRWAVWPSCHKNSRVRKNGSSTSSVARKQIRTYIELTRVLELPTDYTVPLVKFQRKITMTSNPFSVILDKNKLSQIQIYTF